MSCLEFCMLSCLEIRKRTEDSLWLISQSFKVQKGTLVKCIASVLLSTLLKTLLGMNGIALWKESNLIFQKSSVIY